MRVMNPLDGEQGADKSSEPWTVCTVKHLNCESPEPDGMRHEIHEPNRSAAFLRIAHACSYGLNLSNQ